MSQSAKEPRLREEDDARTDARHQCATAVSADKPGQQRRVAQHPLLRQRPRGRYHDKICGADIGDRAVWGDAKSIGAFDRLAVDRRCAHTEPGIGTGPRISFHIAPADAKTSIGPTAVDA